MARTLHAPIMAAMSGGETSMVTRGLRLTRLALHMLQGMLTIATLFPFYSAARRGLAVKRWSKVLLDMLGVQLHVHGEMIRNDGPRGQTLPAMLVANHVSWLDIYAINAVLPVRFVAKSEIRSWPVIGWLSAKTGTLFIERARRRDAVRISGEIVAAMQRGDVVTVFPEGTTTDGSQVLRFHASLLQPALQAGGQVHPVTLRYQRDDGSLCVEAAYDGDKSLGDTLRLIVARPVIHVHLWFLPALTTHATDRRTLAHAAHTAIADRLKF
jgi:1-acyl-sn-glycerol-3-phosphate acyltransferase